MHSFVALKSAGAFLVLQKTNHYGGVHICTAPCLEHHKFMSKVYLPAMGQKGAAPLLTPHPREITDSLASPSLGQEVRGGQPIIVISL